MSIYFRISVSTIIFGSLQRDRFSFVEFILAAFGIFPAPLLVRRRLGHCLNESGYFGIADKNRCSISGRWHRRTVLIFSAVDPVDYLKRRSNLLAITAAISFISLP